MTMQNTQINVQYASRPIYRPTLDLHLQRREM
jgi:hypothetical protein